MIFTPTSVSRGFLAYMTKTQLTKSQPDYSLKKANKGTDS